MYPQCIQKCAIVLLLGIFICSLRWTGYIKVKDDYKLQINKKLKKIINFGTITSPHPGYEELRLELLQNVKHIDNSELQILMQSKIERMEAIDGFSKWRQHELAALTSEVQSAIERNQNPADCSKAKKLVCHMNHHDCGLGCLLHHTAYCLLAALATDRVLILSDLPWIYSNISIKNLFTPISETCVDYEDSVVLNEVWPVDNTSTIEFVGMDLFSPHNMLYAPPSLPSTLAERILRIAKDPDAWWLGQFIGYLMKPNKMFQEMLSEAENNIDFSSPIVGVHFRGTNKIGGGAEAHPIEEYMEQVELWFRKYEVLHEPVRRRIFLATDEPQIVQDIQEKYPDYQIVQNTNNSELDGHYTNFQESSAFSGIFQDIHILTLTNYVVCTYSSNVGLWLYEQMHYKYGDASSMVHSVDIPWWFLYRKFVMFEAVMDDTSTNLKKGDKLQMDTTLLKATQNINIKDENVEAVNIRTQETKAYPKHKLKVFPRLYNFSSFN